MDDLRHHAAKRLNAERERCDVEQQHVARSLRAAAKNIRLHRRAERYHFIGIQLAMWLAAEELAHELAHSGNAGGAADQHDFIDLLRLEPGIRKRLLTRANGALQHRSYERFELLARDLALVNLAARQLGFDRGFLARGECD